jgi:prepilin-type N-terminal cleavage/methylation domain-containing protein
MNMKRNRPSRSGFTLVELLVVILVIAVLAGLLFAAVSGAIKTAKRHEAQTTITALAAAFRAYHTEYGSWPPFTGNPNLVDGNTITVLTGGVVTVGTVIANPKRIVFMEISSKKLESGTGRLLTPWATSSGVSGSTGRDAQKYYCYVFDVNEQGSVSAGNPASTLRSGVGVWTTEPFPNRLLASW